MDGRATNSSSPPFNLCRQATSCNKLRSLVYFFLTTSFFLQCSETPLPHSGRDACFCYESGSQVSKLNADRISRAYEGEIWCGCRASSHVRRKSCGTKRRRVGVVTGSCGTPMGECRCRREEGRAMIDNVLNVDHNDNDHNTRHRNDTEWCIYQVFAHSTLKMLYARKYDTNQMYVL